LGAAQVQARAEVPETAAAPAGIVRHRVTLDGPVGYASICATLSCSVMG
jgi:hypothetical protein